MTRHNKFFFLSLALLSLLSPVSLLAEDLSLFADKDMSELTLVATDPKMGTFRIMDRGGYVLDGTLDDFIGMEGAKVIKIRNTAIVVATEEEYDSNGATRTRTLAQTIPLAQIFEGGRGGQ